MNPAVIPIKHTVASTVRGPWHASRRALVAWCAAGLVALMALPAASFRQASEGASSAARASADFPQGQWWQDASPEPSQAGAPVDDEARHRLARWQTEESVQVLGLLERVAAERGVLQWSVGRYLDPWVAVERYLREDRPALLAALRDTAPSVQRDCSGTLDERGHSLPANTRSAMWR